LPGVKVLGLTATAFRLKKYNDPFTGAPFSQINMLTRERPKFFNHFLHVTQISELYEQNFLAPVKYIELAWSDVGLRVNTTGAEFSEESIEKALLNQEVITRLPGIIKQSVEKGRKHRVVFVNNVLDAEYLATRVPSSAAVHAGTHKKERDRILKAFKAGEIKTVFNVGVLTVGFDFPELDTIILARPTMSLTLYLQIVGRGIRTAPGKEDMAFVDMCGNVARFGHIEEITYTTDEKGGALLMNGAKKLSGVKMTK
jgi:DNA repair protein RadD